jgi:MFS family permease
MDIFQKYDPFLIKAAAIVGSGGLIFGYDIGVISGTLPALSKDFNMNGYEQGLVVSILNAGSIVGCLFGGPLCDIIGRWKAIQIQNLIFIIGALISGLSTNLASLCVGRFLVGVASSISGLADVPYLTEIAPPEYRGIISGQYETLVAFGVLLSFCIALPLSNITIGWRIAFILPGFFALLQSLLLSLLPESPKWLLAKGYYSQARTALAIIYGEERMQYWIQQHQQEPESLIVTLPTTTITTMNTPPSSSSSPIIKSQDDCPIDVLEYLVAIQHQKQSQSTQQHQQHQQSSKLNSSINSSPLIVVKSESEILKPPSHLNHHLLSHEHQDHCRQNSHSHHQSHHHSQSISQEALEQLYQEDTALSQHKSNNPFTLTSEEKGLFQIYRYPIFMILFIQFLSQSTTTVRNYAPIIFEESGASQTWSLVLNILLGIVKLFFTTLAVFYIEEGGRWQFLVGGIIVVIMGTLFLTIASAISNGGNIQSPSLFIAGCALIYAGFGFSYGPIPWILSSEMVPTAIRGRVMSLSLISSNLSQLITGFIFLPMTESVTSTGLFAFFTVINIINGLYCYTYLIETKDVTPHSILEQLLFRYREVHQGCFLITQSRRGTIASMHEKSREPRTELSNHNQTSYLIKNPISNLD